MAALKRQVGLVGSIAIGVSAMLGAGVFFVWKPAWELAGSWLFLSLAIAAAVATMNGLVTAQLAIRLPVAGGIYSYGRHYRGPFAGFMAGWLFVTGKTGSAAAIAYIAASYLSPDYAKLLAVSFVVVFSAVVISGVRLTATISIIMSSAVILGLMWFSLPEIVWQGWAADSGDFSVGGVFQAAGLMFFAFAGYARMATLGEEVKKPSRTIPRAIVVALVLVFAIYLAIALALSPNIQRADSIPDAPLTLLADGSNTVVLSLLAIIASLGSLLAILAGLSRTSLAMARNHDLPTVLAHISPRTTGPIFSEIAVAIVAIVLIVVANPLWLVGLSSAGVLTYYAIGHYSALAQNATERFLPRVVPIAGLALNIVLVATLPLPSLIAGIAFAASGAAWFLISRRRNRSQA